MYVAKFSSAVHCTACALVISICASNKPYIFVRILICPYQLSMLFYPKKFQNNSSSLFLRLFSSSLFLFLSLSLSLRIYNKYTVLKLSNAFLRCKIYTIQYTVYSINYIVQCTEYSVVYNVFI